MFVLSLLATPVSVALLPESFYHYDLTSPGASRDRRFAKQIARGALVGNAAILGKLMSLGRSDQILVRFLLARIESVRTYLVGRLAKSQITSRDTRELLAEFASEQRVADATKFLSDAGYVASLDLRAPAGRLTRQVWMAGLKRKLSLAAWRLKGALGTPSWKG